MRLIARTGSNASVRCIPNLVLVAAGSLPACVSQRLTEPSPFTPQATHPAPSVPVPQSRKPPSTPAGHQYTAELRDGARRRLRLQRRDAASDTCVTLDTLDPGLPYRTLSIDPEEPESPTRAWRHPCAEPAPGSDEPAVEGTGWVTWTAGDGKGCRIDIEIDLLFDTDREERREVLHARDLEVRDCP